MSKIILALLALTFLCAFSTDRKTNNLESMINCKGNGCNGVQLSWSKNGTAVFKYTANWTNSIQLKVWNHPSKRAILAPCARYKKYKLKSGQRWDSGLKVLCKDYEAKILNDGKIPKEGDFKF